MIIIDELGSWTVTNEGFGIDWATADQIANKFNHFVNLLSFSWNDKNGRMLKICIKLSCNINKIGWKFNNAV